MVGMINLNATVNGKPVSPSKLGDPFDLSSFPGVIDRRKGETLENLGRDISIVARLIAKGDPDIEDIKIEYKVEGNDLVISAEQTHSTGYNALKMAAWEEGTYMVSEPKIYLLQAAQSVLKGKQKTNSSITDIASEFVMDWKKKRNYGGSGHKKVPVFDTSKGLGAISHAQYTGPR